MTQQQDPDYGSAIDRRLPIGCKGVEPAKPAQDAGDAGDAGVKQAEASNGFKPCEKCGGSGKNARYMYHGIEITPECTSCNGTGKASAPDHIVDASKKVQSVESICAACTYEDPEDCNGCSEVTPATVKESLTDQASSVEDEVSENFRAVLGEFDSPSRTKLVSIITRNRLMSVMISLIRRERERADRLRGYATNYINRVLAQDAEIERLKARIEEIEKPRAMKPYSEECKPEKSGWYWYAYTAIRPIMIVRYFDVSRSAWFIGESPDIDEESGSPAFWSELEQCPKMPDGGAK